MLKKKRKSKVTAQDKADLKKMMGPSTGITELGPISDAIKQAAKNLRDKQS